MRMHRLLIGVLLVLLILPAIAKTPECAERCYRDALKAIQKIPRDATPILECNLVETRRFYLLLKSVEKDRYVWVNADNDVTPGIYLDHFRVKIYRGDFTNEGMLSYAVVTSERYNTVEIYKLDNGHLTKSKILDLYDWSKFYLHVAHPFAMIRNGKTYLRFMDTPSQRCDETNGKIMRCGVQGLSLCTYIIEKGQLLNSVPNFTFDSNGKLIAEKSCLVPIP